MKNLQISDTELAKRVVSKEHFESFGELYDRYHQQVYNKCLLFVESKSKAEDYTHDIFLKAFINLREFDKNTTFARWLNGITYKMCFDYARKRESYQEYNQIEEERIKVFHCDSEKRLLALGVNELRHVLKKLPPEDRLILLMRYQDDMDIKAIHQQLKISEENVSQRLHRARERAMAIYDNLINQYENGRSTITKSISAT